MGDSLSLITTFLFLFAAALVGGTLAIRLKLPSVLGYISAGILVGNVFGEYIDHELVTQVSQSGVILLLFALGVEFSFHKLKKILGAIAWPAIAQVVLTLGLLLVAFITFGIPFVPALFFAAAGALSSTAVAVKLLSEKGEMETVPGEVATGWLVVQDLAVIPILILLSVISGLVGGQQTLTQTLALVVLAMAKSGIILGIILYLGRHGVPKLLNTVAGFRSKEIFLLTVIGIVFVVSLATEALGLSVALGAFIAGLLVAETSQNHAVFAEIRPLRDLFAVMFFVSLGMELSLATFAGVWQTVVFVSLAVIAMKGVIIFGLLRFMRYHRKSAFLVALYLGQVSEFGFVLAGAGAAMGVISQTQQVIIIAVTFATLMINAPMIAYSHSLYAVFISFFARFPKLFPQKNKDEFAKSGYPIRDHVVICGYGRVGRYVGRALHMANIPFLVVDYNQHVLKSLKEQGIITIYGDPSDKEVLDYAQVDLAKCVVVAIPDRHSQEMIVANSLSLNRRVKIICRTHHEQDQRILKSLGVQTVVQPEFEAALAIVSKLFVDFGVDANEQIGKISRLKIEHGLN